MARPRTRRFGDFRVYVDTTPESNTPTFEMPCGFQSKSFDINVTSGETEVGDCDDPDAPVWMERDVRGLSATVDGNGVMAMESYETWRGMLGKPSRLVRVEFNDTAANGGGYWQGRAVLNNMRHAGANRGEKLTLGINMSSDGEWVWTPMPVTP